MRTTNYELSKKLKEIKFGFSEDRIASIAPYHWRGGFFEKELDFFFSDLNKYSEMDYLFGSFDLETLLEALPKLGGRQDFILSKEFVGYMPPLKNPEDKVEFWIKRQKDESLADTAARLLILLHEKGLVKFGGENE